ncbi:MAG: alpha/beta hydrolase [Chitinophagaceae bacterium]|nr:alpha/beta hydrolase [Chitinophagaceae bacterium]MCW5927613.1 alpha/beta hydrolase [Chitinophagaceae bacterium]
MFCNRWFLLTLAVVLLFIVYLSGPSPATPVYNKNLPVVPDKAADLERYIADNENKHKLKPNNEARVIWHNDSLKNKTEYAIVYLHGFSASQEEGTPVHRNIAKEFGCNLYLARLAEHGIDTIDPLIHLTPEKYWESCKEALAIGKNLGEKVILMGTSTGGSNALHLASEYPDIAALILLSPNIEIFDKNAWLLNNHWGLQIAEVVLGNKYFTASDTRPVYKQYWHWQYPVKALTELQEYLETTMTPKTFKKVTQPLLMLYYYKDDIHQDSVVSVPAMLTMYEQLGTPADKKMKESIPGAGDHVLASYIKSNNLLAVQTGIEDFLKKKLGLAGNRNAIIKSHPYLINATLTIDSKE